MIHYEDFSLKIEPRRGDLYPVIVLRSPAGEGRSEFRLPFDPDELGNLLVDLGEAVRGSTEKVVREAAAGATRTRPQQIGDQLFNALFSGPIRSLLDRSLGMLHGSNTGLRVKLHIDPKDPGLARLSSLPWELMYRKETREFVNLSSFTPILRYLDVQVPCVPLPLQPPLRILGVIANPPDFPQLDLQRERRQIEATWARQGGVAVDFLQPATILKLQEQLAAQPYHVLHFMGHGGFDQLSGSGVLLFEDDQGCAADVDGSTLGVLLRDAPTLRLVFLNACETACVSKQEGLDPFAGVAAALVMAGIPAVVAMQFPITDGAAIRFANRFYSLLAAGQPVDYAVAQGRQAILAAESGTMEWATPVLFMRAPEGAIFQVSSSQPARRPSQPATVGDEELAAQLEEHYTAGLGAFWLEEWDKAVRCFEDIVAAKPDYGDAATRLEEARRWQRWEGLYARAQAAQSGRDWDSAIASLAELVAEKADYRDASQLLAAGRRQRELADLYAQAGRLHKAGKWRAVVNVFAQIRTLDPSHADPDGLLQSAQEQVAAQEREATLADLFGRAVREMDAGHWPEARELLAQLQAAEPGYRGADRLLARTEAQIAGHAPAQAKPTGPARAEAESADQTPAQAKPTGPAQAEAEVADQAPAQAKPTGPVRAEAEIADQAPAQAKPAGPVRAEAEVADHAPAQAKPAGPAQAGAEVAGRAAPRRIPVWAAAVSALVLVAAVAAVLRWSGVLGGRPAGPAPGPGPVAGDVVFSEDFEAGGAARWGLDPGWRVERVGDNHVLTGGDQAFANLTNQQIRPWGNYSVRFRLLLVQGSIHLGLRHIRELDKGDVRYFVQFSESGLILARQVFHDIADLTRAPGAYPLGRWYTVTMTAVEGHLQVFVDGELKLEFFDPNPLLEGGISFETTEGSGAMVDDVEVRVP